MVSHLPFMVHTRFTRHLHNVSWLQSVDVILLLCSLYIFDIFCIQLQVTLNCVSVANIMWSMRLWKMSIDQLKKYFCNNIFGTIYFYFVERWVRPNNILRSIFLFFIFGVFKINFEPFYLILLSV